MRMSWMGCRYRLAPGTLASLPRSRAMIWSGVAFRSSLGLRDRNTRPVLVMPPPPTWAMTCSTPGSPWTMSERARMRPRMAWKEVSWSAWIMPFMRPPSCWGKKPLGTTMNRATVVTTVPRATRSTGNWWRSTHSRAVW